MFIPIKDYCNKYNKKLSTTYQHIINGKLLGGIVHGDRGQDIVAVWEDVINDE